MSGQIEKGTLNLGGSPWNAAFKQNDVKKIGILTDAAGVKRKCRNQPIESKTLRVMNHVHHLWAPFSNSSGTFKKWHYKREHKEPIHKF